MSQWKKVKLGELYEVHNGLSKGRKFFGKGFPFLSFTVSVSVFTYCHKKTEQGR